MTIGSRWEPIYEASRDLKGSDREMSQLIIQLWTSFIKTGVPTSRCYKHIFAKLGFFKLIILSFKPSSGVEWSAVTGSEQKYLVLDNEPYMARTEDYAAKMDFWQQIFPC